MRPRAGDAPGFPRALKASAATGAGLDLVREAIESLHDHRRASGRLENVRAHQRVQALRRALERGTTGLLMGHFWDPLAVRFAVEAGEGATLMLRIGGKCGPSSGDPVDLEVTVRRIKNDATQTFGAATTPMGTAVWLSSAAGIDLLACSSRCQVLHPDAFTQLGIEPAAYGGIAIKSIQHFYAGFAPIACRILYIDGPGAIPPDFANIPYEKFDEPYWPRDEPASAG